MDAPIANYFDYLKASGKYDKRLQEAKHYINFCLKEGVYWDEEELSKMTDDELIKFAEEQMERADYYANTYED